MSTNPGATILPVASIVSAASPSSGGLSGLRRRTSPILPSLTARAAWKRSAPVPSTTFPPVILRSNTITPYQRRASGYGGQCNTVTGQWRRIRRGMTVTHTAQPKSAVPDLGPKGEDAIGTPPHGPTLVPAERYYSAAFAQLEAERMWP